MIILPDGTTYEGEFDRGVLIREVLDQNSAPGDGTPSDQAPVNYRMRQLIKSGTDWTFGLLHGWLKTQTNT